MNKNLITDYWTVRGNSLEECKKEINKVYKKDDLISLVINNRLNDFLAKYADGKNNKRIPYIGWYWRSTDFVKKKIPIGDCGEFIGVMENNKWNYNERYLTEEEADKVIEIIWEAKRLSEEGGCLDNILNELWDLFQTFKI